MQILKLVYIAHGWSLGLYGRPLIDEPVEAWQYGPVIPSLYRSMKGAGAGPVAGPLPIGFDGPERHIDTQQLQLVDDVYRLYGHMTGPQLSRITHAPNTPWQQTYRAGALGQRIPVDLIADHYARLSRERAPAA